MLMLSFFGKSCLAQLIRLFYFEIKCGHIIENNTDLVIKQRDCIAFRRVVDGVYESLRLEAGFKEAILCA